MKKLLINTYNYNNIILIINDLVRYKIKNYNKGNNKEIKKMNS